MEVNIGSIVLYRLSEQDVRLINSRRSSWRMRTPTGTLILHEGSEPHVDDQFPMIVTRRFDARHVSGVVQLDGNDTLWVGDVYLGGLPGEWHHQDEDPQDESEASGASVVPDDVAGEEPHEPDALDQHDNGPVAPW